MNLYAESSAVLSWLLEEASGEEVGAALAGAGLVCTSDLTLIECDRALLRAGGLGSIPEDSIAAKRAALDRAVGHWVVLGIAEEVVARARQAFPVEPVRALDAIHLATALAVSARAKGLVMLSLDYRVRDNATAIGLAVLPGKQDTTQ